MLPTTPDPMNRRNNPRALIAIAVRQTIGQQVHLCQANDISTKGIFLASIIDELVRLKSRCLLEFNLPGSDVLIQAKGRIVRHERNGKYHLSAVEFAALAPSHRRLIESYIDDPRLRPPPAPAFLQDQDQLF